MTQASTAYSDAKAKAYGEGAHAYADKDPGRLFIRRKMEGVHKAATIVDVGCGNGIDLAFLKQKGFRNLTGVEPSLGMRKEAREILGRDMSVFNGSFEKIPQKDASADVVISRYAVQQCRDLVRAFSETARIIKPNGLLVVVTTHPQSMETPKRNADGTVTVSLFKGKVLTDNYPYTMDDFAIALRDRFLIKSKLEYHSDERDGMPAWIYTGFCFAATRYQP